MDKTNRGRRTFLAAAGAGLAGLAAGGLGRPGGASAANGDAVLLGRVFDFGAGPNEASKATVIDRTDVEVNCFLADSEIAVAGYALVANGLGLYGQGEATGVSGYGGAVGVVGTSTPPGVGVRAENPTGTGLRVVGRASFSNTGTITVPQGQAGITKGGLALPLSPNALILATIQGDIAGVWVRGVRRISNTSFRILLNKAAPSAVKVGWFIVN